MPTQRIPDEKDTTPSAEVENKEVRQTTSTENEQKRQEIELDEVLDDRFQATDN